MVVNDLIPGVQCNGGARWQVATPASSAGVERVFSAAGKRCTRTSKSPPRLARSRRLSLPCRMCSSVGAGASRLPRGLLLVGATHAHSVGLLAACAVVAVNKLLIALGHSSITIKLIEYILLMVHSDSYLLMVIPCLAAHRHHARGLHVTVFDLSCAGATVNFTLINCIHRSFTSSDKSNTISESNESAESLLFAHT